jgi:hypothetical protein
MLEVHDLCRVAIINLFHYASLFASVIRHTYFYHMILTRVHEFFLYFQFLHAVIRLTCLSCFVIRFLFPIDKNISVVFFQMLLYCCFRIVIDLNLLLLEYIWTLETD